MDKPVLGVHEKADLHELFVFKTQMLLHTAMARPMAKDARLKQMVEDSFISTRAHVEELKKMLDTVEEVSH